MPTKTVQGELLKVAQCMLLSDFTAQGPTVNGVAASVADIGSLDAIVQGNPTPCNTCHSAGAGGFVANADPATMLSTMQSNIHFVQMYIAGTVDMCGNFAGLAPSNEAGGLGLGMSDPNHPPLDQTAEVPAVMAAVQQFVARVLTRYNSGQCP
jgi:hypothetical protein